MTYNTNPQSSDKKYYDSWAKGFMTREGRVFHPYTKKDFKFETNGSNS